MWVGACVPPMKSRCSCRLEKGRCEVFSTVVSRVFIDAVASEMVSGIDAAVECWMLQIENALEDPRLTTLGRLQAVEEIVANYRTSTGGSRLRCSEA